MPKLQRKSKRMIYLDNAASTPLDPRVFLKMKPFLTKKYANPSALYNHAVRAREAVEQARANVAEILGTQSDTIIYTSGGTESCNLAVFGTMRSQRLNVKGQMSHHIITTKIEHHAVLHPIQQLEKEGCDVTYLPVDSEGKISLDEFKKFLRPETILVSIMYANNEIGTINPIPDIGREILKWRKANNTNFPYFHTDACQAGAYLDLNVERLHVDLMSLNGSKIYGPKGTGILYKRRNIQLEPIMYGGGQEFGLRPGTENVAGIIGFSEALTLAQKNREKESKKITKIRDYFWNQLQKKIKRVTLNGPIIPTFSPSRREHKRGYNNHTQGTDRLPNNLNVTFSNIDAEALIIYLDEQGIVCSSGSACTTESDEASHVLLACGISEERAKESIRFTLGKDIIKKDIDDVIKKIDEVRKKLR